MGSGTFLFLLFAVAAGAWISARFIPMPSGSYSRLSSLDTNDDDGPEGNDGDVSVASDEDEDEDDAWRRRFNLDGTLMINHHFDINGNAYGAVESDWNSFAWDD